MNPNADHERPEQPRPVEQPNVEKKKRFRIEKIEERIAPKHNHCNKHDSCSATSSGMDPSVSIY